MSQELRDALFIPADQRSNFKNVIAKRSDLARFDAGRMKSAAAGTIVTYEAGLVVGLAASGPDAGKLKPYDDTATDGSQTAVGVLAERCVVDSAGNGSECVVLKAGVLFRDLLIGLDAGAIADLKGAASVEHGVNLLSIYA